MNQQSSFDENLILNFPLFPDLFQFACTYSLDDMCNALINASLSEQRLDAVLKADLKTIIMDAALDPNKRKFACFILLLNRKNRTDYQLIKNLIKHFITWNTQDSLDELFEWILGDEKQDFSYRSQYLYLLFEMIGDKEIKGIHNQIDFLFSALGKLNSRLLLLHSHKMTQLLKQYPLLPSHMITQLARQDSLLPFHVITQLTKYIEDEQITKKYLEHSRKKPSTIF